MGSASEAEPLSIEVETCDVSAARAARRPAGPAVPPASSEAVRHSMQGNRSKNTKPELLVRRYLREAGLTGYRLQWKGAAGRPDIAFPGRRVAIFVHGCFWHRCPLVRRYLREAGLTGYRLQWKGAAGRPDIAFPGRRVAIFVHGCFWHRCPYCHPSEPRSNVEFWNAKFQRNQERDRRDAQALLDAGWTVVVVWECRLKKQRVRRTMEAIAAEVALTEPVRVKADVRPGKLVVLGITHIHGPSGLAARRVRARRHGRGRTRP